MQLNLPGDVKYLRIGEAHGDVDRGSIVRRMIQRTIKEHFDREKVLRPLGIKVLTVSISSWKPRAASSWKTYERRRQTRSAAARLTSRRSRSPISSQYSCKPSQPRTC